MLNYVQFLLLIRLLNISPVLRIKINANYIYLTFSVPVVHHSLLLASILPNSTLAPKQPRGLLLSLDSSGANRWLTPAEAAGCPASHLPDCFTHANCPQTGLDYCGPEPDPTGLLLKYKAHTFYGLHGWFSRIGHIKARQ